MPAAARRVPVEVYPLIVAVSAAVIGGASFAGHKLGTSLWERERAAAQYKPSPCRTTFGGTAGNGARSKIHDMSPAHLFEHVRVKRPA